MFERFTDAARLAVVKAQEEARRLHHGAIGTEHLLLGLLVGGEREASRTVSAFVSLEAVRSHVEGALGRGDQPPGEHVPFAPPAKQALEGAFREAKGLGHEHIGTEHLLLGLLRDHTSTACEALVALGADLEAVREQAVARAGEQAPASGLRSWGGSDPMSERVARSRARAQAEQDPVHESDPGGWELLARAGTAVFQALAAARRRTVDDLRGEIASIDLAVGVLAARDPVVREALAEAGADDPAPARLVPGYRGDAGQGDGGDAGQGDGGDAGQGDGGDAGQGDGGDAVVTLSGEARRACSMAVRLVTDEHACVTPAHLLLATLEALGPVRAVAAAQRLGVEEAALRSALLRRTVTLPQAPPH